MKYCIVTILCSWLGIVILTAQNTEYRDPTIDELQKEIAVYSVKMLIRSSELSRKVGEVRAAKDSGCAEVNVFSTPGDYRTMYILNIDWSPCQGGRDEKD